MSVGVWVLTGTTGVVVCCALGMKAKIEIRTIAMTPIARSPLIRRLLSFLIFGSLFFPLVSGSLSEASLKPERKQTILDVTDIFLNANRF